MSYCKCLVGSAVRVVGKTFENKVFLEGLEQPEDALTFKKSLSPLKKERKRGFQNPFSEPSHGYTPAYNFNSTDTGLAAWAMLTVKYYVQKLITILDHEWSFELCSGTLQSVKQASTC